MAKVRLTKPGDTAFHVSHPLLDHLWNNRTDGRRDQSLKSGEIYEIPDELLNGMDPRTALTGLGLDVEVIEEPKAEPILSEKLHLPDISISGFRGINNLTIPRLGRVTLLAGGNGVGKTTILEAFQAYAARGRYSVLSELASKHEEYSTATDEDGDQLLTPNLAALFYGRDISENNFIEIGPQKESLSGRLRIEVTHPTEQQTSMLEGYFPEDIEDNDLRVIRTTFRGLEHVIPMPFVSGEFEFGMPTRVLSSKGRSFKGRRRYILRNELAPAMECVSLGPGLMQNDEVANFWDNVALTEDEKNAVGSLQLVLGSRIERVAMIGGEESHFPRRGRRVIVKLTNHDRPVPLKSLGDGATRLFAFALALANSRNGFLLIDEAENGIHYSVHSDFWRIVLRTARKNNVQVIATTHGWDCIKGFAQAAIENQEAEGVLIRLERDNGKIAAVEYSEDELETASKQGIEVR